MNFQAATGSSYDIIPLLYFTPCYSVYFASDDSNFGSDPPKERSRFFFTAENEGHIMTFQILKDITKNMVCHSKVYPGDDTLAINIRINSVTMPMIIKYRNCFYYSFHSP